MAIRKPVVIVAGELQQLQAVDTIDDPKIGSFAPGSFSLADGQYALAAKRVSMTGTQRITLAGTSRLRID